MLDTEAFFESNPQMLSGEGHHTDHGVSRYAASDSFPKIYMYFHTKSIYSLVKKKRVSLY